MAEEALAQAVAAKMKAEASCAKLMELLKQYKTRFKSALEHVKTAETRAERANSEKEKVQEALVAKEEEFGALQAKNRSGEERWSAAEEEILSLRKTLEAKEETTGVPEEMREELRKLRERLGQPEVVVDQGTLAGDADPAEAENVEAMPPGEETEKADGDAASEPRAASPAEDASQTTEDAHGALLIALREKTTLANSLQEALERKTAEQDKLRQATAKSLANIRQERTELLQKAKRLQDGFKEAQRLRQTEAEASQQALQEKEHALSALRDQLSAVDRSHREVSASTQGKDEAFQRVTMDLAAKEEARATLEQHVAVQAAELEQARAGAQKLRDAHEEETAATTAATAAAATELAERIVHLEGSVATLTQANTDASAVVAGLREELAKAGATHAEETKALQKQLEERRKQSVDVISKAKERLKAAAAAEAERAREAQCLADELQRLRHTHEASLEELEELRRTGSLSAAEKAQNAEALTAAEEKLATQEEAFNAYKVRARAAIAKVTRGEQVAQDEQQVAEQALEAMREAMDIRERAVEARDAAISARAQEVEEELSNMHAELAAEQAALLRERDERQKEAMALRQAVAEATSSAQSSSWQQGLGEKNADLQAQLASLKMECQTLRRQRDDMRRNFAKTQEDQRSGRSEDAAEIARLRQVVDRLRDQRANMAPSRGAAAGPEIAARDGQSPAEGDVPDESGLDEAPTGPSEQASGEMSEDIIEAQPMQQLTALVQQEAQADAYTTALAERAATLTGRLEELQQSYDALQREHSNALDALRNQVRGGELNREENEGVFRLTYLKQAVLAYMKCGKGKDTEREALIPVISRILLFTNSERKAALKAAGELRAGDRFSFFSGS